MAVGTTRTAGQGARRRPKGAGLLGAVLAAVWLCAGAAAAEPGGPARAPVLPPAVGQAAPDPAPAVPPVVPAPAQTAPVSAPATPPVAAPARPAVDPEFDLRAKALEESVDELKEKVFRAKARLQLLGDRASGADLSGAKASLVHRNEMGSAFALESLTYRLDGATVFDRVDVRGDLAERDHLEVWSGRMMTGRHTLEVMASYRGNGYGIFKYTEGYKFRVSATFDFTCEAGKITTVTVVGYEKGGITAELKDRPAFRLDVATAPDTGARAAEAKR